MTNQNSKLTSRPPVVVVMGHVDHGKTSLLDFIRKSHVAQKEAGSITQHIGAYEILHHGKKITFIDTPGHEAFGAMRSRGATAADIAILVVDASDGVKAQTKEAVSHIKKAGLPMVAAINKIDLPHAFPDKIKDELAKCEVLLEERGGKVPSVQISAKTGQGVPELMDLILLLAEMEKLQADPSAPGQGVVIETFLDNQRGPTATLLLKQGQLAEGDAVAAGEVFGRIRNLEDFQGNAVEKILPSSPALVIGFEKVPRVGESFKVLPDLESAQRAAAEAAGQKPRQFVSSPVIAPEQRALNIILRADVVGSLEALAKVLQDLPQEKVVIRILDYGVGQVSEKDVKLARQARAAIISFRVGADPLSQKLARLHEVLLLNYEIIYELAQGVRTLMEKRLAPETVREILGKLKVLAVFGEEKGRQIFGGRITEGEFTKGVKLEIEREGEKVGQGRVVELQKNRKEIGRGVRSDEIGILYDGRGEVEKGDVVVAWREVRQKAEL